MVEAKGVRGGRTRFMSSRRWRVMWGGKGKGPRAESSDSISNFAGPNLDIGFKRRRRMGHTPANKAEESAWSATFPLPDKADSPNSTSPLLSRPPWIGMASSVDGMEESVGSNSIRSTAAVRDYYFYTPSTPNPSDPFSFPDYTPSTPPPSTPPPNSPFYTPASPLLSPHCIDYYSYTPSTPNASDPFSFPDYTPSTPPPSPPPPNSPFYTPATPTLSPIFHTLSPFQLMGSH